MTDARIAREDVLVALQKAADTRIGRLVVLAAVIADATTAPYWGVPYR